MIKKILLALFALWQTKLCFASNDFAGCNWQEDLSGKYACQGYYTKPKLSDEIPKNKTYITTDEIDFNSSLNTSSIPHKVDIEGHKYRVKGDKCHIKFKDGTVSELDCKDLESFYNSNVAVHGKELNFVNGTFTAKDSEFIIYSNQSRGSASEIEVYVDDEVIIGHKCSFSTCAPDQNSWTITGKKITIDQKNKVIEINEPVFRIKDKAVFAAPYISFSTDKQRKTGFLVPDYSDDSRYGKSVRLPYYFNLYPNSDLTVTPVYYSRRGYAVDNLFRYLRPKANGDIIFYWLPHDRQLKIDRKFLSISHHQAITPNLNMNAGYSWVSDSNLLTEIPMQKFGRETLQLPQFVKFNYKIPNTEVIINFQRYQSLFPTTGPVGSYTYFTYPSIDITNTENYKSLLLSSYVNIYNYDSNGDNLYKGLMAHYKLVSGYYRYYGGMGIKTALSVDFLQYALREKLALPSSSPGRVIPTFEFNLQKNNFYTLNNHEVNVKPKLYFLYTPNINQERFPVISCAANTYSYDQLFRNNRYVNYERISNALQITYGVDVEIEKHFNLKIAQAYFFDKSTTFINTSAVNDSPYIANKFSPISILSSISPDEIHSLTGEMSIDPYSGKIIAANSSVKLVNNKIFVLNAGYVYLSKNYNLIQNSGNPLNLVTVSGKVNFNESFNLVSTSSYNIQYKYMLDFQLGVEYSHCCYNIKAGFRRQRFDYTSDKVNRSVFVEFALTGLSSYGLPSKRFNYLLKN